MKKDNRPFDPGRVLIFACVLAFNAAMWGGLVALVQCVPIYGG